MRKRVKGPTWKKGQVLLPDVYHPPQEMADPEGHLSEEQKKWPRSALMTEPSGATPPEVQEGEPHPRPVPQPPAA
jgi:hypothetical protein